MIKIKKFIKLYKNIFKKIFLIIVLCISIILCYFSYKYITKKKIYIGCLYAKTGIIGIDSYNNYLILKDSLNYVCKKKNINLEFIFLYKDLGDNLNNFYNWMEECIKKYNTKYFFGCWRSNERKKIIPLLIKYNVRLFYAIQYEGYECVKQINYFGSTPNQQLIPALKYIFSKFEPYKDIYIIGNKYIYPITTNNIITNFIKNDKLYAKIIKDSYLFEENKYDFKPFIKKILKESKNGAIIINLINGSEINNTFIKTFYYMYYKDHPKLSKKIYYNNKLFLDKINDTNIDLKEFYNQYPIINLSISENSLEKNNLKYMINNYFCTSFTDQILDDPIYQLSQGINSAEKDLIFLKNYKNKNKILIDDALYGTFLSALFFVNTIDKLINNNLDINDTNIYDKYRYFSLDSVGGAHEFESNNNISKNFIILKLNKFNIFNIVYQNYKSINTQSYINVFSNNNKDVFCNWENKDRVLYINSI